MCDVTSLTPRETSSGLRRPRLASELSDASSTTAAALKSLTAAQGNFHGQLDTMTSSSSLMPPPTPEALRSSVRSLKERRLRRVSNLGLNGDRSAMDTSALNALSTVIRSRTAMTLRQAYLEPDGADLDAAREMELYRQRTRLEDLRRTFDLLHAELVSKEEVP